MFSEANTEASCTAGAIRSSTVMCGLPPVVRVMTTSEESLTIARTSLNRPGSWTGWPSWGSRTCRWTMAAPAAAAPSAACAICSGVIGRAGDIVGVWIAPVGAQVMIAGLPCWAMGASPTMILSIIDSSLQVQDGQGGGGHVPDGPLVVLAPDKFKGSLSAPEVVAALARGLRRAEPAVRLVEHPIADGGEGTVDMVLAHGFQPVSREVRGPTGERVTARYALRGEVAVIEMAAASGLWLLPQGPDDETARTATTLGVGQLIRDALDRGARRIVLGIGGSATTDGGRW